MIRRILYWVAVVAISALLTYLVLRLAEALDASQVGTASLLRLEVVTRPS